MTRSPSTSRDPSRRGATGTLAFALGLSAKADNDIPVEAHNSQSTTNNELQPMPVSPHPDWSQDMIQRVQQVTKRMCKLGDTDRANNIRMRVIKPRNPYFSMDGIEGMVSALESAAAARAQKLNPVKRPHQYKSLSDIDLLSEISFFREDLIPPVVQMAILKKLNTLKWRLAASGHAAWAHLNSFNASAKDIESTTHIRHILGATSRLVHQLHYYQTVSRVGARPHAPMTFAQRLRLLDEALEQVAIYVNASGWSARSLNLLTQDVRDQWTQRETKDPTRGFFPRTLFEYASPRLDTFSDQELERLIQQHPDLAYVEKLRAEKLRRTPSSHL